MGTCNVVNEVGVTEGTGGPARFDVGSKSGKRVKETVGVDRGEGVVVKVISVVVPLVEAEFDNIVSLDDPDKFFAWVVEIEFDFDRGVDSGLITSELKLVN